MRLFVAIFPPKNHLDYFRDTIRFFSKQKRNLIPTPIDQLHLTLKYIGSNVSEYSKDLFTERLLQLQGNYPKPEINIKNIQFGFQFQSFPKHLLANIEMNEELEDLTQMVHGAVKEQKQRDTIRWKTKYSNSHHITLARLKGTATGSTAKLIKSNVKNLTLTPPDSFTAEEMFLIESLTSKTGRPIYRRIEQIKL